MADKPFPAYEGDGSYFFVSYAHEDARLVYPEMAWIGEAGFNLWYDDGIHVGSVWRRALADALNKSSGMVFFCTERAAESENCLQEINFALDDKKPIFVVQMDETPLPAEVRLSLSSRQALRRAEFDEETFRSRLVTALTAVVAPTVAASPEAKTAPKTDPPSIVILPFASLSDDRELAFLAEGMAGNLIASMPFRMGLWKKVQGQPSEASLDPMEIGKRRGVRYVLSGNLQKGGDKVRATVNLTETSEGQQIWAQRFDRSAENVLDVQDQLVASILDEMGPAIGGAEADHYRDVPDEDLDAWGLVNRTRGIRVVDRASRDRTLYLLRRAVEIDPNYGPAHAILANVLTGIVQTQFTRHPDEFAADALRHADKAIELMPNQPWALDMCSTVHVTFGNEAYALRIAERASDIIGLETFSIIVALIANGRFEEMIDRGSAWSTPPYRLLSTACVALGRNDDALDWAERAVAEDPRGYLGWVELANVLGLLGRTDEALEALAKARAIVPTWTLALYEKGIRVTWRNKEELVEPMVAGLRKLGIDEDGGS